MRSGTLRWMMTLAVLFPVFQAGAQETQVLKTEQDKVNYGIGVGLAKNLQRQSVELDVDLVVRGLRDALSGKKLLMSDRYSFFSPFTDLRVLAAPISRTTHCQMSTSTNRPARSR